MTSMSSSGRSATPQYWVLEGKRTHATPLLTPTDLETKERLARDLPFADGTFLKLMDRQGIPDEDLLLQDFICGPLPVMATALKQLIQSAEPRGVDFVKVALPFTTQRDDYWLFRCGNAFARMDEGKSTFKTFKSTGNIKLITHLVLEAASLADREPSDLLVLQMRSERCDDLNGAILLHDAIAQQLQTSTLTGFKLYALDQWASNMGFVDPELSEA